MEVRNNYQECLTNLACSIRKYFGLEYKHNTLDYIDKVLEEKQPKNVVIILYDGMGSRILDRVLKEDSFFNSNRYKEITTVFPATTTAATTSIRTGLNPVEHGWLGWNVYLKPFDKIITLFRNVEKNSEEICEEYVNEAKNYLVKDTIVSEINEKGKYKAYDHFPFGENPYTDLDEMLGLIEKECKEDGKKFIYGYDPEPDHTMHEYGPNSEIVKQLIEERNAKTQQLCERIEDYVVIIVADHGHLAVETVQLTDYPSITNLLERNTSLEPRATSFKVVPGKEKEFEREFLKEFGNDFKLYPKEEVIESELFGDGEENSIYRDALGDYLAIANGKRAILMPGDEDLYSMHAGYTDDEIYVPLILIKK